MTNHVTIKNNQNIPLQNIPVLNYGDFLALNTSFIQNEANHCVSYSGYSVQDKLKLICCVANDTNNNILLSSCELDGITQREYPSFTAHHLSFHIYERELHENFGIR